MTHAEAAQHGRSGPASSILTPRTIGYGACAAAAAVTGGLALSYATPTLVFVAARVALAAPACFVFPNLPEAPQAAAGTLR